MRSTFIGLYAQTLVRYSYGLVFFFFKQKTAYEMRISDWSSDVCSSDLGAIRRRQALRCRAKPCRHSRRALPAHLREGAFSGDADTRYRRSEERRVGKECVVSVDLGGRRIIKKKK